MQYLYGNVNVESLISHLNELKNLFQSDEEKEVLNKISSSDVFSTTANAPLYRAMYQLIEEYADFQKEIDLSLYCANQIEVYQNDKEKVLSIERKIDREENEDEPDYSYIRSLKADKRRYLSSMQKIVEEINAAIS